MAESCWACARLPRHRDAVPGVRVGVPTGIPMTEVSKADDIALCTPHWNWWLTRWLNAEDAPPCGAHLILTDESLVTAMDRHRARAEPGGSDA